jgi:predicted RNA-binding protein associated with RNAse of E/G family
VAEPAYAAGGMVEIHYLRPPDRVQVFRQEVVDDDGTVVVTYLDAAQLKKPVTAGGRVVLEPGAPVVWFTYRGETWHDVGRFHLADGTFTGIYANVLTPVRMAGARWDTTDLFLDVWLGADGHVELLDRDEFHAAVAQGVVSAADAERAFTEAERLIQGARQGAWPPAHVQEWTLQRARAAVGPGR